MQFFLLISLAHLLGDYPFQTNWIYLQKTKSPLGSLLHVVILGACFAVLLAPFLVNRTVVLALAIILIIHFLQDCLKIELVSKHKKISPFPALLLDQFLHFALLIGVALRLDLIDLKITFAESILENPIFAWVLIYLITLVLVTFVWDVVKFVWNDKKVLQHEISKFFTRGAIVTLIFGATYLFF